MKTMYTKFEVAIFSTLLLIFSFDLLCLFQLWHPFFLMRKVYEIYFLMLEMGLCLYCFLGICLKVRPAWGISVIILVANSGIIGWKVFELFRFPKSPAAPFVLLGLFIVLLCLTMFAASVFFSFNRNKFVSGVIVRSIGKIIWGMRKGFTKYARLIVVMFFSATIVIVLIDGYYLSKLNCVRVNEGESPIGIIDSPMIYDGRTLYYEGISYAIRDTRCSKMLVKAEHNCGVDVVYYFNLPFRDEHILVSQNRGELSFSYEKSRNKRTSVRPGTVRLTDLHEMP